MYGCHSVTALQALIIHHLIDFVTAPDQRLHGDGAILALHGLLHLAQVHTDFGERVLVYTCRRADNHDLFAEFEVVAVHTDFGHSQLAVIVCDEADILLALRGVRAVLLRPLKGAAAR